MSQTVLTQQAFNAGELSPLLYERTDLEKTQNACRQCKNMIIMKYGGVRRRPGTEYLFAASDHTKKHRLIPFQFNITQNYVLVFEDLELRIYDVATQTLKDTVVSPYGEDDLYGIQIAQQNDVAYLTHPSYHPQKLSRLTDTSWTLVDVAWKNPVFAAENLDDTHTMTYTGTLTVGSSGTLTTSTAHFNASHVGAEFRLGHKRTTLQYSCHKDITGNGNSGTTVWVNGKWTIETRGAWDALVNVQEDNPAGSGMASIITYRGDEDGNVSDGGETTELIEMQLNISGYSAPPSGFTNYGARAVLKAVDPIVYGRVRVTGFTNDTTVTVEVVTQLFPGTSGTGTEFWAEEAFSAVKGYPRAVSFHEQRLCFAGTSGQPQTVWGSAIDDYENFLLGSDADQSWEFTLASSEYNVIQWLVSQRQLLVGTIGGEWVLGSGADENPITPENVKVVRHAAFGSEPIAGVLVNDVVLFVQRNGRKVREMAYSFEKGENGGYVAADMTLLAEHITSGTILETAYQAQEDSILWCVTGNGKLVGLTYERTQNVIGWHEHTPGGTGATIESACAVYGSSEDDEIWLVVKRTIDGGTKRYIERFQVDQQNLQDADDKDDLLYLDSALEAVPSGTTVSGLSHLEGETVSILLDGAAHPDKTVTAGAITLDKTGSKAQVGLSYTSTLETNALSFPMRNGSSQGREKRIHESRPYFYKSLGGQISKGTDPSGVEQWDDLIFRQSDDLSDVAVPLFTGYKPIIVNKGHEKEATVKFRISQPFPMTILSITNHFNVYGGRV